MSVSTIKAPQQFLINRQITWPYSITANGQTNTNLKTLIDADIPSGYTFLGIVGFSTAEQSAVPVSIRYINSNYSAQLKNVSSSAISSTLYVYYLAVKL